ncbi:YlbL family protein [Nocardioides sp. URHA0032]|uniref:YlbL family protein n=1 Tax=Nocardioides sp. URHA0032 TaxID=1380388 RepID=UPI00048A9DC2|nr:PDZ domain-containing protein [Nocardioides sp. URHA0032]
MTQRTLAGILAVPLLIALWVTAALVPLPYVTYEPGLTVNVLGKNDDGKQIIQVEGRKSYPDDGQVRMTTVYVSQPKPNGRNNLFELMHDWISDEDAVYPYDAVYRQDETVEQNRQEGAAQMTSSQDAATAVALEELGYDVTEPVVAGVTKGAPADGNLESGDVILAVDGTDVSSSDDVVDAVTAAPAGAPVDFVVRRDDERTTVQVTPDTVDGKPQVGIQVGTEAKPDLPVDVTININPGIGGPSAGLMFSLGIYDTLTPGSLTGGETVAGTGTMDATGTVGPIGGIQQKIVGARDAGAQLFLVPPDNCEDALGAPNGDMRLVKADTMHDARLAIDAWVKDPNADLPSCEEGSS